MTDTAAAAAESADTARLRAGRRRLAVVLLLLCWIALAGWIAWRLAGKAQDDFFITYRYAWNLAAGQGFVFNPGERVFGTTEPGLGLLLAGLALLTRQEIPALGTAVTAAALVGIAALLLLGAARRGQRRQLHRLPEAAVGGTLLLSSTFLWANHGAGAFPALLLLLLAARLGPERPLLSGLAAGLAVWVRPDAAVGTGILGLLLWGERRRLPWIYGFVAGATIGLGALWATWVLGSPLPNTLLAKHAMAVASPGGPVGAAFWPRALPLLYRHVGDWWLYAVLLGALGQVPLLRSGDRAARLLSLFGLTLVVLYPVLKVPFFPWYSVPVAVALLYGVAAAAGALGRRLPGALGPAAALALLSPVLFTLLPAGWQWLQAYDWYPHLKSYREAALYLHQRSQPNDAIAYVEIGVLAYYSRQPVDDLLGLVTPAVLPYVEKNDLPGAFLLKPTPWVAYHTRGRMGPLLDRRWFWNAYEDVAHFKDPGGDGELTLFHRRPGSALPESLPPGMGKWNRR
ncbi:MAG TPA: hypothetical protein VMM92_13850 [Thermoanaerobaculia bacterium]|nr:hypothetical protein [Thermoanaerobaculia bacterium]